MLVGGAFAQSSTLQRLEELETQQRKAKASEDAKWRIFSRLNSRESYFANTILSNIHGSEYSPNFCRYYWSGWKLDSSTGIRTTRRECRPGPDSFTAVSMVAVHCATLKISEKLGIGPGWQWLSWELPKTPDREMVVALCDNIK